MSKIIVLGTGHAMVTEYFNSCFLIEHDQRYLLVDTGGGNGILAQLKKAQADILAIHDVFITHSHFDHMLGLFWIIRSAAYEMRLGTYVGNLNIYITSENAKLVRDFVLGVYPGMGELLDSRILFVDVFHGMKLELLDSSITVMDLKPHERHHFGFRMDYEGKSLSYFGDVPYHDSLHDMVFQSDWLMHEAFCLDSQMDIFKPHEKNHSTVKDACEVAAMLEAKNLVLFHTEDDTIENRRQLYIDEGRQFFNGNIFVPDDLDVIEI